MYHGEKLHEDVGLVLETLQVQGASHEQFDIYVFSIILVISVCLLQNLPHTCCKLTYSHDYLLVKAILIVPVKVEVVRGLLL